jgi:hypothetical protein
MKGERRVGALAVCALLALVLPTAANAGQQAIVKPKSLHLNFHVAASNGYAVSVHTSGHRQIKIGVEKGDSFAFYTGLGHVSRKGIEADLGRFGQISLRFLPKSRSRGASLDEILPPALRRRCRGRASVLERGLLVGNIRFEGEHGYVRAVSHRVKASLGRDYKRVCGKKSGARAGASAARSKIELLLLSLEAHRRGVERTFTMFSIPFPTKEGKRREGLTIAVALRKEKIEGVGTAKATLFFSDVVGLVVSPRGKQPLSAEAKLPAPFAGSGVYVKEPGQIPTWSGDFGVHLPGSGLVPLTGDEFEFDFCRAISDREVERCADEGASSPRPLAISPRRLSRLLTQGSGSHSQPLALARLSSLR